MPSQSNSSETMKSIEGFAETLTEKREIVILQL